MVMTQSLRPLNVLIATPFGPGGRGGMDRLTDLIIDTLKQRPDLNINAKALTTYGTGSKWMMPFIFCRSIAQLISAKLRHEVDVVHINVAAGTSSYRKAILAIIARFLGLPYVVHLHGSRFHETWPSGGYLPRQVVDQMFIGSAEIIVLGRFWAQLIGDNLPEVQAKITILPNATKSAPERALDTSQDKLVTISFLGELGPRKGTPQLIEALGRIASVRNWQATVAGNGNIETYRELAESLGIAERVSFPGWLGPESVDDLLSRSDVFVLPSFAENLPMSILEAFAHGAAVISTPVGAIAEVVDHGRSGLIVPAGDVEALAGALRQLVETPVWRHALADEARRKHAEHYDIAAYIVRLKGIWCNATNQKARPA